MSNTSNYDQTLTPESFKNLLKSLTSDPTNFSEESMTLAFEHIVRPQSNTSSQISAFLTALKLTGNASKAAFIAAAAKVMRSHSIQIQGLDAVGPTCDIVGTGGDGLDTFNVSTCSAVVAAGAGATVTKVSSTFFEITDTFNILFFLLAWCTFSFFSFRFS